MTTISFTLSDKDANKTLQINHKINNLNGEFFSKQTKDGTAYIADFENDVNGKTFQEWINELLPSLYEN